LRSYDCYSLTMLIFCPLFR